MEPGADPPSTSYIGFICRVSCRDGRSGWEFQTPCVPGGEPRVASPEPWPVIKALAWPLRSDVESGILTAPA